MKTIYLLIILAVLVTSVPAQRRSKHRTRRKPVAVRTESPASCAERIRANFLKFCSSGNCARHDIDIVTPADCHHLTDTQRLAAAKGQ